MTYEDILSHARERSSKCKACAECNGLACRGMVPGPGGKGSGKSFIAAVEYFKNIDVMMDPVYDNRAGQELKCELFGVELSMPVMAAPCGGAQFNYGVSVELMDDRAFVLGMTEGARRAGTIGWIPDGPGNMGISAYLDVARQLGGLAIPTLKPWSNEVLLPLIRAAESYKVPAIACDVDSAGLVNLKLMGTPVDPKSPEELRELCEAASLPFIVKGLVTPRAALLAADAGAAAIVVSNHGGRIIEDAPAPISMLSSIRAAVGSRVKLIVDGGVRTGGDVFKALALGADAVLIGRPVCTASIGGGAEGVALYLERIKGELRDCMLMTGCHSIADITVEKIRNRNT